MKHKTLRIATIIVILLVVSVGLYSPRRAEAARTITFPIIGPASYSNDYHAPRSNGPHHAIDIFANKMQKLVAVRSGTITFAPYPEPSYGYYISIRDDEGFKYNYLHLNNDNPGTDDGQGGGMLAYARDVHPGNRVVKGQLIGWVGDSGNAENTPPHLHFEMEYPDGRKINPYNSLREAKHLANPVYPPAMPNEILPYGYKKIGMNIAMGNFDADSAAEIVTGPGKGELSWIRTYEQDRTYFGQSFHVYNGGRFRGGIDVAGGDVDGDGLAEIITGAGPGGNPNIRVFKLVAGVATLIGDFNVYDKFDGGMDVAAADLFGGSGAEIITGAGPGGNPNVRVFESDGDRILSINAYTTRYRGGIRVSAANIQASSSKSEFLTVPATKEGPHVRMFSRSGSLIRSEMFMEEWWEGFHDVGAGLDRSFAATGVNRRASVRESID